MNTTILLVEDEVRMREIVRDYFQANGFKVIEAENGAEALEKFHMHPVDLIILDIMMPEMDGWSVCRRVRKESDIPIIMLTARSEEDDQLMGFELGADEYVIKPFSPKVLVVRARNILKRAKGKELQHIEDVTIDRQGQVVKIGTERVTLTPKEFELLLYLVDNEGIVLSREQILNQIWGYEYYGDERVVDTHIKKLRKKIQKSAKHIHTVIGTGYKFEVLT
ncbi:response regulator transcription factor [Longirhabdus pacifica]|uniref:response regulator transcription factor n=1 Tax=Longirhabdus pacifica TaxID=2305227 RepID=UPI00100927D1|nr:response regulator transcription factor [Longirhabdus pacifica]